MLQFQLDQFIPPFLYFHNDSGNSLNAVLKFHSISTKLKSGIGNYQIKTPPKKKKTLKLTKVAEIKTFWVAKYYLMHFTKPTP